MLSVKGYTFAAVRRFISKGLLGVLLVAAACTSSKRLARTAFAEEAYHEALTGYLFVDLETGTTLHQRQPDALFTPASNTKLLTLATCLAWLPADSLPAMAYATAGDTLRLWATAYPELGVNQLPPNLAIRDFINDWPGRVELSLHGYRSLPRYGEGWMWDDYPYAFARERSGLPVYRNITTAWRSDSIAYDPSLASLISNSDYFSVQPGFLIVRPSTFVKTGRLSRNETGNRLYAHPELSPGDTLSIPIHSATGLAAQLLEDWTGRQVPFHNQPLPEAWGTSTLKGLPRDELLRRMMMPSDNFLAEQLFLQAGLYHDDLTNPRAIREAAQRDVLTLNDTQLAWADASGISHYNLISPRALVHVIRTLHQRYGHEQLTSLLPAGGQRGTIKSWYAAEGEQSDPYVFAKTGTLRHNHCLSGVFQANSGRWIAFSMMHNHFRGTSRPFKEAMQRTLAQLAEAY